MNRITGAHCASGYSTVSCRAMDTTKKRIFFKIVIDRMKSGEYSITCSRDTKEKQSSCECEK